MKISGRYVRIQKHSRWRVLFVFRREKWTAQLFDYYYRRRKAVNFLFYRIPASLSPGSNSRKYPLTKLLYGLPAYHRMGLSARTVGTMTLAGSISFYTLDEIQEDLNCGQEKVYIVLLSTLGCIFSLRSDRAKQQGGRATNKNPCQTLHYPAEYLLKPLRRRRLPDFRKSEVKKSENQKSRVPIIRSQDFRFSEVQTSENQTVIILNLIKLILAIKIHLSIHRLLPRSRDGWIEASI